MPDPLAPVVRGQPLSISAQAWNLVTAAARDHRQNRRPQGAGGRGLRWGGVVEAKAVNATGSDLREYRPAAITDAGGYELPTAATDWQRDPLLTLAPPASASDFVVVTLEAIPDGAVGRVAVAGVVLCEVDLSAEPAAEFASPQAGSTASLRGVECGTIRVLHRPVGGGSTRPCVVYLGDQIPDCAAASGSGGAGVTVVTDVCLDGSGGGYVRKARLLLPPTVGIDDQWCEAVVTCGSGAGGNLCDDLPPGSGSGSGSGSGGGRLSCCPAFAGDTLTATLTGEGSLTLTWDGTNYEGSKALSCGETIHLRYTSACGLYYSCDGANWVPAITGFGSRDCGPPVSDASGWTCDMDDPSAGCAGGSCGSVNVVSVAE